MIKISRTYTALCVITTLFVLILASTYAINLTNYGSNNAANFAPQIDAFNQYQVDAEACNWLSGAWVTINTFQDWGAAAWPYNNVGYPNANGILLTPNTAAQWAFAPPDYPEMKWGVYRVQICLITSDPNNNLWGPNAPVDIQIEVDGVLQYEQIIVWSNTWSVAWQWSVVNNITIDFHFNWEQQFYNPIPGQPWVGLQHQIWIRNMGATGNWIYIDEFHLTTSN